MFTKPVKLIITKATSPRKPLITNKINFLPNFILYILLAIVFYLSLTYLIDSKIRNLFNAVINEVIKKRNNEKGTMEN